ncbi:hypothetical protein L2E69_01390 [Planktothrix agardhii 1806]|uniref:hypothetical protein n=2 Tax=Planktothrix agardhii TaxID=1160 RepID=UPI001D0BB729|nr:hypothetical protein [Planktothrix agardhii]MCB8752609.1 hypothetical protein [Planktothrix agardhii 1810]MCF3569255.1 hypothetical protein [Planktothrix agardhii 1805]MCF3584059.1 hypothetical protein [Planktothrix agardhii 1803]MCF3604594.1 hypothetical protein [Planktothrix agardhii 1804]MCF3614600.1 hypothetical protein [Planktothrix agardhii 1806]
MLSSIKQQVVVGRNGKIEIQTSDLAGGIIVEVIVLVKQDVLETNTNPSIQQDETEYLPSTQANREPDGCYSKHSNKDQLGQFYA